MGLFSRKRVVKYGATFIPLVPAGAIEMVEFSDDQRAIEIEEIKDVDGGFDVLFSWIEYEAK